MKTNRYTIVLSVALAFSSISYAESCNRAQSFLKNLRKNTAARLVVGLGSSYLGALIAENTLGHDKRYYGAFAGMALSEVIFGGNRALVQFSAEQAGMIVGSHFVQKLNNANKRLRNEFFINDIMDTEQGSTAGRFAARASVDYYYDGKKAALLTGAGYLGNRIAHKISYKEIDYFDETSSQTQLWQDNAEILGEQVAKAGLAATYYRDIKTAQNCLIDTAFLVTTNTLYPQIAHHLNPVLDTRTMRRTLNPILASFFKDFAQSKFA